MGKEERIGLINGRSTCCFVLLIIAEQPVPSRKKLLRSMAAEFLGTMLFVFLGCGSVISDGYIKEGTVEQPKVIAISLAHGLAIMVLVFATAKISGGQLNPVVTFALMLLRKETLLSGLAIMASQIAGGLVGAAWLLAIYPTDPVGDDKAALSLAHYGAHQLASNVSLGEGFVMECILTFVLVFVVLRTAVDADNMGNFAPMAIGFTVAVLHLVGINVTGASMNPARSFGPAVIGNIWSDHWIFWVGPFTGSFFATAAYAFVFRTPAGAIL